MDVSYDVISLQARWRLG